MNSHEPLMIGFSSTVELRGSKAVITIKIVSGDPEGGVEEDLTPTIDIAYVEGGKAFVRQVDELWKTAYKIRCPICDDTHPLSLTFLNALVMAGEGMAKSQIALNNFALDHLSFN